MLCARKNDRTWYFNSYSWSTVLLVLRTLRTSCLKKWPYPVLKSVLPRYEGLRAPYSLYSVRKVRKYGARTTVLVWASLCRRSNVKVLSTNVYPWSTEIFYKTLPNWDLIWNHSKQTCEFCGKSFSTKLQLNRHSKIHDEQNHVTCLECGKTFNSKGNLKIHLQHCLKEGKFKCQYCPMKFHYKNALKTHLVREHDQEREFECSICGTQFMHKKNYTRIRDLLTNPFL